MTPDLNACLLVTHSSKSQESILSLLQQNTVRTKAYSSPLELLESFDASQVGCLVLELNYPEMSGITLWQRLVSHGHELPCVFICMPGNVCDAVRAMKLGALDVMEYPLDYKQLLTNVQSGLMSEFQRRLNRVKDAEFEARIAGLTKREREVMHLVAEGMLTKVIAKQLGISIKTVEVHRSNLTQKMGVRSVAQLVRKITEYTLSGSAKLRADSDQPGAANFPASA